jgi:hypothetical protein
MKGWIWVGVIAVMVGAGWGRSEPDVPYQKYDPPAPVSQPYVPMPVAPSTPVTGPPAAPSDHRWVPIPLPRGEDHHREHWPCRGRWWC